VARARSAVTKDEQQTKAINTLGRKVLALQNQTHGPKQFQTSQCLTGIMVAKDYPCLLHVNNFATDGQGPVVFRRSGNGDEIIPIGNSELDNYVQSTDYAWNASERAHVPNVPRIKALWAHYQFQFHAFTADTRIRIDVIRRKRNISTSWFNQNEGHKTFLPHTLPQFSGICGFGPDRINTDDFKIIMTKHCYLNSAPSNDTVTAVADALDSNQDDVTEADTVPTKTVNLYIPLNKEFKCLRDNLNEVNAVQNIGQSDMEQDQTKRPEASLWAYDNQNPFDNVWIVISTDSTQHNPLMRNAVHFKQVRRVCWRDRLD